MRITLIAPPMPFSGRVPMAPPILEYLGALIARERPDIELTLVDADAHAFDPTVLEADLVGISAMTATVTWAYATADRLRARGTPVVLGGIHPSALPDEAALHADAVVVGEAESIIAELLDDASRGALRPAYQGTRLPLDGLPRPLAGALAGDYRFRAVFTARGCPYGCRFCSVRRFFGPSIRYRPIGEVVDEVEACLGRYYFNGDDNIWGGDSKRTVELFRALASDTSRRQWYGFGDLAAPQRPDGDDMLAAARASGLSSVWVGWESTSQEALTAYGAVPKQGNDREEAVRRITSHGIEVVLFMVLGGREDSLASFERTLELSDRLKVQVHPVLLTPLPGTELFEEYRPHLLPGTGWERYTGTHAVFEHPDPAATPQECERRYYETALELLGVRRVLGQIAHIPMRGFPSTHAFALAKVLPIRRAMRRAYDEWLEESSSRGPSSIPPSPGVPPGGSAPATRLPKA